jgi:hypothetical protein
VFVPEPNPKLALADIWRKEKEGPGIATALFTV